MEEKEEWVDFRSIDWECPKNNRFNLDTRDFCCGYLYSDKEHPDMETLLKYKDRFFVDKTELKSIINRLYIDSGGEKEWRFLSIKTNDKRFNDWSLKYLRIFRTDHGFIFCDSEYKAINKEILKLEINKELL